MSQPAARIMDFHTCPLVLPPGPFLPPVPHIGGPVVSGQPNVLISYSPAARVSDTCFCAGVPDMVVSGAFNVLIGNMPAARMGDSTIHGGVITTGAPTVLIGTSGAGGGGMGGLAGFAQWVMNQIEGWIGTGSLESGESGVACMVPESASDAASMSEVEAQADRLREAAESGVPFVEACCAAGPAQDRQQEEAEKERQKEGAEMSAYGDSYPGSGAGA
ncbi:hypothetical protein FHY55_16580 [Oceanicola sp. D3]|uniref:PAAR domain-containing protein n=1 Tax=Oceanicola sp. D3 TaxID=2587163 RepID=UPI001123E533|nr:PAAR domain-containing protein [Oceanicola sp. D3]QDC10745.1 hypothetical protein FHY55_16580 [Oceanicola sp. D3]